MHKERRFKFFLRTERDRLNPPVQNVDSRVNLDPWIIVLVVEYFFRVLSNTWVLQLLLSTIININRLDGATCSQTVYGPNYSPRTRAWFLRLFEVNVLRSEHLIYHKKNTRNP